MIDPAPRAEYELSVQSLSNPFQTGSGNPAWQWPEPAGTSCAGFDEIYSSGGDVRDHWIGLFHALSGLGVEEMSARAEDIRRLLDEHGVSCPVFAEGEWREQPWELDLMPFVLPAAEWAALGRGLEQRARLLNSILGDLHSSQRLVRDGLIPAPLVFANPAYLRACQAITVAGGNYLQLYAADLVRAADGVWRVLTDRTQVPTGIGFALENRSVLQRVLPEALRAVQPRSLDRSLRLWRDAVSRLAVRASDNPVIAVFTPGARNEAYFEHAYLARRLGFTLAEGGDLTVRHGRVCIKTLERLRPVDVLLRRTRDFMSDPLELRADSLLGVPGLVEAVRAGHVAVTNCLGSGLVEGPAFLPFLHSICRHLFREDLLLDSVPSWWCGTSREFREAERRRLDLGFRPAFAPGLPPDHPAHSGSDATLDGVPRDIDARSHEYVSQERVHGSKTVVWEGRNSGMKPVCLRAFVVFDGHDYHAVPGGLARVFAEGEPIPPLLPLAGRCQDVWVLNGGAPEFAEILSAPAPTPLIEHASSDLPSRAAENLFWLGRYTERLEQRLRIVRCGLGRVADESGSVASPRLSSFATLLIESKVFPVKAAGPGMVLQRELLRLLYGVGRNGGVRPLLENIHQAAFGVRDRLSSDTWRILNRLIQDARPRPGRLPLVHSLEVLNRLILDLAALSGMETENMTRGFGWRFLDVGRRIERASGLCHLLGAVLRCPPGLAGILDAVLEIADSTMTYRRRHFSDPQLQGVIELLARETSNPRSIAFQLHALAEHAAFFPDAANPVGAAQLRLRIAEVARRSVAPGTGEGVSTDDYRAFASIATERLQSLAVELAGISDLLTHVYHSHVVPRFS